MGQGRFRSQETAKHCGAEDLAACLGQHWGLLLAFVGVQVGDSGLRGLETYEVESTFSEWSLLRVRWSSVFMHRVGSFVANREVHGGSASNRIQACRSGGVLAVISTRSQVCRSGGVPAAIRHLLAQAPPPVPLLRLEGGSAQHWIEGLGIYEDCLIQSQVLEGFPMVGAWCRIHFLVQRLALERERILCYCIWGMELNGFL